MENPVTTTQPETNPTLTKALEILSDWMKFYTLCHHVDNYDEADRILTKVLAETTIILKAR